MEVVIVPNQRRRGAGKRPVRENRRAWLPQQARFCPVVEDASRSGFLVYPPLHEGEALQIRYLEPAVFRLSFEVDGPQVGQRSRAFVVDVRPSAGGGGLDAYDLQFLEPSARLNEQQVLQLVDALVTNVHAPPGGIGVRGAYDFVTPEGWDTVYLGVVNESQRPHIPVLAARIETDWYAQNTEFRYALQPGEVLSIAATSPVGQVLFLPREPVELRDGDDSEQAQFSERQRTYWTERHAKERATNFGTLYSYHYRDEQKARAAGEAESEG